VGGEFNTGRLYVVIALVLAIFVVEAWRGGQEQLLEYDRYLQMVVKNSIRVRESNPFRGDIVDRDFNILATSVDVDSAFAVPRAIEDKPAFADTVAPMLGLDADEVLGKIENEKHFVYLKRKISVDEANRVRDADLVGLQLLEVPEKRRYNPHRELAGQVLGIVNDDQDGIEGVEFLFNQSLKGEVKRFLQAVSPFKKMRRILGESLETVVTSASSIVLTLDRDLQESVEKILAEAVILEQAQSGMVLVTDVTTGEILAMANFPFVNPNSYWLYPQDNWTNAIVTDALEPGSTMKPLTYAIALDLGVLKPTEMFKIPYSLEIGGHHIKDVHHVGVQSAEDIIRNSSNIGTAMIARRLEDESVFYKYLRDFGLGARLGIDFPGEAVGMLSDPARKRWGVFRKASIAFGQGVAVSTLQLHYALATLANGGVLMRPMLVRAVVDAEGNLTRQWQPEAVRRVVKEESARKAVDAMQRVVGDGGTGGLAFMPFYEVFGKTGTAQIAEHGAYLKDRWNALFFGAFPRFAPRYAITVVIVKPVHRSYGGEVSAPVFRRVAEALIQRKGFYPVAQSAARERFDEVLERVATINLSDGVDSEPPQGQGVVPDFHGLTLRESLRLAARHHVMLEPAGDGAAVDQSIDPFLEVPEGTTVVVQFEGME
jgi:cell division protein FtsI (penicillin-binding protein 3)